MTGQKKSNCGSCSSAVASEEAFSKNTITILRTRRHIVKLDTDRMWRVFEVTCFAILYLAIAIIVPTVIVMVFGGC